VAVVTRSVADVATLRDTGSTRRRLVAGSDRLGLADSPTQITVVTVTLITRTVDDSVSLSDAPASGEHHVRLGA